MATWLARDAVTSSWSSRQGFGGGYEYGSDISYEEASINYDGGNGFNYSSWSSRSQPSSSWSVRTIPT